MLQIIYKELRTWTAKPIFYILLGASLLCVGTYVWFFRTVSAMYNIFHITAWVLVLLIPFFVSRILLEEIRNKTLGLLLSKPISLKHIVLGKFLAMALFLVIFLLLTLVHFLTITHFSEVTFVQGLFVYLFIFLMGLAYVSVAMAVSSFCISYIKAFFGSLFMVFLFHFLFNFLAAYSVGAVLHFFEYLGIYHRLNYFLSGGVSLNSLVYLVSIMTVGLVVTYVNLKNKEL